MSGCPTHLCCHLTPQYCTSYCRQDAREPTTVCNTPSLLILSLLPSTLPLQAQKAKTTSLAESDTMLPVPMFPKSSFIPRPFLTLQNLVMEPDFPSTTTACCVGIGHSVSLEPVLRFRARRPCVATAPLLCVRKSQQSQHWRRRSLAFLEHSQGTAHIGARGVSRQRYRRIPYGGELPVQLRTVDEVGCGEEPRSPQ